jgi:hypothetical protein
MTSDASVANDAVIAFDGIGIPIVINANPNIQNQNERIVTFITSIDIRFVDTLCL